MRSLCLVNRLEFDFACGSGVLRDAMAIGDVDNDGNNELIVGNTSGDLIVFKGTEQWQKISGLGMITCVCIGDILNCGRNALIVIGGEGWCRIYYSPRPVIPQSGEHNPSTYSTSTILPDNQLGCVHVQRIPANTKVVLLGDIDADGLNEMVLALTDRVVRSYRWYESDQLAKREQLAGIEKIIDPITATGKLVCLNKWESGHQIGAVTLHHTADGYPTLLVAQPGGTFMRIRCNTEDSLLAQSSDSVCSESSAASRIDYQFLGMSRMRNPNVSTEVLGDLNIQQDDASKENITKPYAVATLDGTIMLVRDEIILWAIQVDHQIFALEKLDITGDGREEIVACSWDGQTYMLDQNKNSIRFQLDEPVQAFCCGYYTVNTDSASPEACLVYVTFKNKIYIYHDLQISNMVCKKLNICDEDLESLPYVRNKELDEKIQKRKLKEWLLYGCSVK